MLLKNEKSPLHQSALRLRDLTVGRCVIVFDTVFGVLGKYIVLSQPFVDNGPDGRKIRVMLRNVDTGLVSASYTEDMGVTSYPFDGAWRMRWRNLTIFTVDHRKQDLLPEPFYAGSSLIVDGTLAEEYVDDVEKLGRVLTGLEALK